MGERPYIPALGYRWFTRFYDPLVRLVKEDKIKHLLVAQARLEPGHRVLDVGCGTGTLAIMLKQACPQATVVGLDADEEVLAIARSKAATMGVEVEFRQGLAWTACFDPRSFDRVVSTLFFHHLASMEKQRSLAKIRAWLRPGGELHIGDWGKPQNVLMRLAFLGVQLLDGFETTSDNVSGRLQALIREAGFQSVEETHREMTILGTLSLYRAVVPGAETA